MDWNAQWIWCPTQGRTDNFYMHARKVLTLESPPSQARIHVTAGSLYKLYVNGQYVGRGPNPADPSYYYYDTHEVGHLLRPGGNVISATCYSYSEKPQGIIGQNWGRGGFLLEMRDGQNQTLLATDGTWRVVHAPEWDQDAPINCTLYADYKEYYNSRRESPGWQGADFDDSAWSVPEVLGKPPVEPYTRLVPREIPFLAGPRVYPENAWTESASVTYAWRDDWEVYHHKRLVPGTPAWDAEKYVEVLRTQEDFAPSIILDFGRDVTGYPKIVIHGSAGGTIDVLYGEDLRMVRVDRFVLKGGPQTLEPFNRRTFRYMKLLFVDTPQRIEIDRVWVDVSTFPVEDRGAFACSDDLLNRIWDVGRYTIRISMLDHFVDCPWRERTIYGGDVYAENLIAQYAFGDGRLNRKTLRQMFALQYPQGPLPPYGPYRGCHGFYSSWSAFFGLAFVDHWQLNGDREFLQELWPQFRRLVDWAADEAQRNDPHLVGSPAKGGSFEAWSAGEKVRFSAWEAIPWYVLLQRAALLAGEIDGPEIQQRYAETADLMGREIRRTMIDPAGLCVPHPRSSQGRPAQTDSAYLLWSGLLDRNEGKALAAAALSPAVAELGCPFQGLFLVEGVFDYQEDHKALDYIRRYWGEMLARGATTFWEHFAIGWPKSETGSSLCHGWSAGPTYSLGARVLGVRPLEPGFARVLVEPRPCDLTWAAGEVPTPHGPVRVGWNRTNRQFRLSVRLSVPGVVSLSAGSPHARLSRNGQPVEVQPKSGQFVVEVEPGEHEFTVE